MQQKIPIENLYYLLCYAWGVSDQLDKVKVDGEKCHSLENLLSMVLIHVCDRLLRQGLVREYRFEEQEVEGVRGKLNLAETLKSGKHLNGRTICQVDELTQDVVINRVIFSTLKRLMRIEGIDEDIRVRLRKTLVRFPHIQEIRVTGGIAGAASGESSWASYGASPSWGLFAGAECLQVDLGFYASCQG